jgi:5-(aminomethyl)-3-furanmethanol phosphate kinase
MMNCPATFPGLTVVKLGGSFAFSPELPGIVTALDNANSQIAVVPGGGPFADTVREAQPRVGFDDTAAHKMALMAMAQFAESLVALGTRLRSATSIAAIDCMLAAGHVPVWSPWPMTDGLADLPPSWDLTSDSLAAWLGARLNASVLVLLKQGGAWSAELLMKRGGSVQKIEEAAKAGIVDPLFPIYAEASGASVYLHNPSNMEMLRNFVDLRILLPSPRKPL